MKQFRCYVNDVYVYLDCNEVIEVRGPYELIVKHSLFSQEKVYYLFYSLRSGAGGRITAISKQTVENYMKIIKESEES